MKTEIINKWMEKFFDTHKKVIDNKSDGISWKVFNMLAENQRRMVIDTIQKERYERDQLWNKFRYWMKRGLEEA